MTLTEVLIGSALSILALTATISVFLSGMKSWATGQGKIQTDVESQQTIRTITGELREAMSVTVDANGLGLSYRLPAKDANGAFVVPATWDGVNRRIEFSNGRLQITGTIRPRVIAKGVLTIDPGNNNAAYRIFVPGAGTIIRELDVMVITSAQGYRTDTKHSRIRETIFLRNIPSLSR